MLTVINSNSNYTVLTFFTTLRVSVVLCLLVVFSRYKQQ